MTKQRDAQQMFDTALEKYEQEDFAGAFDLFLDAANLGDDGAQNYVGYMYDQGVGRDKDKQKALYWYKRAFRRSKHPAWAGNIALSYAEQGQSRRAIYWWRKAISLGDGDAALELAKFLIKAGRGKASNQVGDLLKAAAKCHAGLEITPDGQEEARGLLKGIEAA